MGSRRIYGISYLIKYLINNYVTASMQSIRSTRHWTHSLAFQLHCVISFFIMKDSFTPALVFWERYLEGQYFSLGC